MKAKLQANISIARALKTVPTSDPCIYEVQDQRISSIYRILNISNKSCTCKKIFEFGFPCEHIYAVIVGTTIDEKDFIIEPRKINTLRKLYTDVMKPVDITTFSSESNLKYIQMNRRGRQRRNESARIPSLAETIQRKTYSCRYFNGTNHNVRTYPSRRN